MSLVQSLYRALGILKRIFAIGGEASPGKIRGFNK